jgi:hypothetical protein
MIWQLVLHNNHNILLLCIVGEVIVDEAAGCDHRLARRARAARLVRLPAARAPNRRIQAGRRRRMCLVEAKRKRVLIFGAASAERPSPKPEAPPKPRPRWSALASFAPGGPQGALLS